MTVPPAASAPGERAAAMSYLVVFLVVSVLIFIHELGHYAMARLLGIPIARFSVGLGRAVWSRQRGETEYRVSLIPFGGYVLPAQDSYFQQSTGARLLFVLGGPAANIALTFVLSAIFNIVFYGFSLHAVLVAPFYQTGNAFALVFRALPAVFSAGSEAVGPLGIVTEGGDFIGSSFLLALQFGAVMSMNLAVINLVPIPPLDGGRVVLGLLELVSARATRLHIPFNVAGFLVLLGFLAWVTTLDVRRLVSRLLA